MTSRDNIQIPAWLASIVVCSIMATQGWMLREILSLRADVSGLRVAISMIDRHPYGPGPVTGSVTTQKNKPYE